MLFFAHRLSTHMYIKICINLFRVKKLPESIEANITVILMQTL